MMPGALSEQGAKEWLESREKPKQTEAQPKPESILKVMKLCQENNVFQFKDNFTGRYQVEQ